MEPPGFTTSPSKVTILVRYRMARASSFACFKFSTMMVLPNKFSMMFWYLADTFMASDAILMNPCEPRATSLMSAATCLGWITFNGKKVARPKPLCFKYWIAWRPSFSLSTITCCNDAPKAVSIACVISEGTLITSATAPWIPLNSLSFAFKMCLHH